MVTKIETIFMTTQNENVWETCLVIMQPRLVAGLLFIQGLLHTQAKLLYKCILTPERHATAPLSQCKC